MKIKKIWGNLAVKDIQRTNDFYTKLGFKPNSEMNSKEMTSFSFGESNFIINFFLKDIIEKNTKTEFTNGSEIIFSLSAESKDEVEEWINIVKNAGGKISVEPYEIGEGYTFVFSDPDGHKFNVLYWPGM